MRRAARILFLIGMILSIVLAVSFFICGLAFVILGANPAFRQFIIESVENGSAQSSLPPEETANLIQGIFVGCGIPFFFISIFGIVNAVVSAKAKNGQPSRALCILNIVFGILSDVVVNVVGGVLCIIQDGKDARRKQVDTFDNQVE